MHLKFVTIYLCTYKVLMINKKQYRMSMSMFRLQINNLGRYLQSIK